MKIVILMFGVVLGWSVETLHAEEMASIDSYKCSEFLSDSKSPDEALKLIRPLVTIAWATGFAAAHQKNRLRADLSAMYSISVIAGDACRKNPEKLVTDAIVDVIGSMVGDVKR